MEKMILISQEECTSYLNVIVTVLSALYSKYIYMHTVCQCTCVHVKEEWVRGRDYCRNTHNKNNIRKNTNNKENNLATIMTNIQQI